MNKELLSVNAVTLRFPHGGRSFWSWTASRLPSLGNWEGFSSGINAINIEFGNFSLPEGACYSLCGPESFAKTAFFRLLMGDLKQNTGSIQVTNSISSVSTLMEKMPGKWTLLQVLSENLFADGRELLFADADREKLLVFSDLFLQANLQMEKLSTIEKVRLATTLALFSKSQLALLDEALFACDEKFINKVFDRILLSKSSGKSFLVAAPSADKVKKISNKLISFKFY